MNRRTRLCLGFVATLLVAGLTPPLPAVATPVAPDPQAAKPPARYLYAVTFTAAVTYGLRVDRGGPNYDATKLSTTLTGTLPDVEVGSNSKYNLVPRGGVRSTKVRTSSSAADATTVSDDGLFVDRCIGNTAAVGGRPVITTDFLEPMHLFGALTFPTSCTDNQGHPPGTGTYVLPRVATETVAGGRGNVGDDTYTLKAFGDAAEPPGFAPDPELCHGYEVGITLTCSYQVKGTLTLKLIKKVSSEDSSNGASVTPTKARATVICPSACTIQLSLTPLKGGPTIAVERISPTPRRRTTVTVPIPPKKRDVVTEQGGVRIQITYTLTGGVRLSETRTALL